MLFKKMWRLQMAFLFLVACMCTAATMGFTVTCKEADRKALLTFKHSFSDRYCDPLSSWVGRDCCSWIGVGCDNVTGNVIKLDMWTAEIAGSSFCVLEATEVNPALLELKYLTYLDLRLVNFNGSRFPKFFGSMRQLQHLDLSNAYSFRGKVPNVLGNLTQLVFLDLHYACWPMNSCELENLEWASNLKNLKYLDLSGIDLSQALDTLNTLHKLPSLSDLILDDCQMENSHLFIRNSTVSSSPIQYLFLGGNLFSGPFPPSNSWGIFSSLSSLWLSRNYFTALSPVIGNLSSLQRLDISVNNLEDLPPFLGGLSSLKSLQLSDNNLSFVPTGNFSSLQSLDISFNNLEDLPPFWGGLSSLEYLDLSNNNLTVVPTGNFSSLQSLDISFNNFEDLPPFLGGLSSLEYLDLSNNNLTVVPTGNFSSLRTLDLSHNNLETLLPSLGTLSSLSSLDLSYNNLSVVHQVSLANLSRLDSLDLSSNSAIFIDLSPDWIPPFQLAYLQILPCKLNSPFPSWILSQKSLFNLDLSNSGIFGPLPINIGDAMPYLSSLRLANNHINGTIPTSLCGIAGLDVLDLRKNRLSGKIPDCWENSQIVGVELSSNKLSGHIPNSLTKVATLQLLSLNNNSLEGELPLFLSNSPKLTILDVGKNNLHGEIPPWNGAIFPFLQILILRENSFSGTIPLHLCSFHALQIIDLASNNLVGTIPWCFGYLQGMGSMLHSSAFIASAPNPAASNVTSDVASEPSVSPDEWSAVEVIKGEEREYTTNLHLLANMDLSCNHLVGVIPAEITSLSLLLGLNLSHNHLNGTIPMEMGKMRSLESLDLSFNNLSGSIPETVSSLDSLSKMNFSFNNLQGQIPTGRHLQTLNDSSIYMGNPDLCGDPLPKKCFGDNSAHPPTTTVLEDEGDNKRDKMWLYMVTMLGFATGFWGVIGILVVHKKWRHAYFQIAEELTDWIYIRVAVRIAQANRGR